MTMQETVLKIHLEVLEEGGFLATSPDVPGLVAEGKTMTEAIEIAQALAIKIVESCLEHDDPIPVAFKSMNIKRF